MIHEYYQTWQQSHCLSPGSINLADAVMQKVTQKLSRPGVMKRAWEVALLDKLQAKVPVQAGLICLGAVLGIVRLFFQMASMLFA